MLGGFKRPDNPDLIVGFDTSDDAGVYRVAENLALVQTLDIITPVCDDPSLFGAIAAANALSDVYAMGGRPLTAMNICCFPATGVPDGVFAAILEGSHRKIIEAGATLVGGHTVRDDELKYGLSVTGLVDPAGVLTNAAARTGDALVLTKPVGTGAIVNGARKDLVPEAAFRRVLETMARLNSSASAAALAHQARACTDVTGFGLAGHALEMSRGCGLTFRIDAKAVPFWPAGFDMISRGVTTAQTAANREQCGGMVRFDPSVDPTTREMFFDPQTSGGLLVAVPSPQAGRLVSALVSGGDEASAIIGEVAGEGAAIEVHLS